MELAQNPTVFNSPDSTPRHAAVKFHGEGKTYFGIWLTNLLLTILTFGIYGAWAKVRTQQFMLGSIEMDGHRLRYHAKPMQILVGRLIAITFFGAFMATVHIFQNPNPLIHYGSHLFHCFALGCERVTAFSLRMTSYRTSGLTSKAPTGEL